MANKEGRFAEYHPVMFTGLIQATGAIVDVTPRPGGIHIRVDARALRKRSIAIGDSIAVNGVCLTATDCANGCFGADVSAETLSRTTGLDTCRLVNLETALTLGDALGGHLVSGHVDGIGLIESLQSVGDSTELVVRAPQALAAFIAVKGSITVDGVSLTVNRVLDLPADPLSAAGCRFHVNLIPHTVSATAFQVAGPGHAVNLEIDLIARYLARMAEVSGQGAPQHGGSWHKIPAVS
jgi:riboflavin synthase